MQDSLYLLLRTLTCVGLVSWQGFELFCTKYDEEKEHIIYVARLLALLKLLSLEVGILVSHHATFYTNIKKNLEQSCLILDQYLSNSRPIFFQCCDVQVFEL